MPEFELKDLLLAPRLEKPQVADLLAPYGLKDFQKADLNLQAMAGEPGERLLLADVVEDLLINVRGSANPDQALTYFERFARATANKAHLYSYLRNSRQAIEIVAKCFGGSVYMAEILIRDPHHFYWVTDAQILNKPRTKREIQRELLRTLKVMEKEDKQLDHLRAVKRREMLHIGVRDLLRLASVEETLSALSVLAEALITAVYWISASALRRSHGIPSKAFTEFTILAMGKLGGGELNFSSDVDLMFLYASDKEGSANISAADYFRRLSQKITAGLNDFTGEGYVYRVDLRLRPEGDAGNMADPIDGYERYYRSRMGTWERLALLKALPVAGSRALGTRFLEMARRFIHQPVFDLKALADVRDMKAKVDRKVLDRGQAGRNVKLGAGGIREIELVVQSLQVGHGSNFPQILSRNTLAALGALRKQGLLSEEEFETLHSAYLFLRDVENKLQMVNDAQTHSLPREIEELNACARLLGYPETRIASAADQFLRDFQKHTTRVNEIFENIIGAADLHRFVRSR
jgi:[glutamine synthetase] adenylyltransferase / [glutamine synthetase]-adenylyl-L-tyrosine phosphorylase